MSIAEKLRELHEKQRVAGNLQREPSAGFSSDELRRLELACGHALPAAFQALLQTAGVFDFGPEVFLEDVGYFCLAPPETMIADAANLRGAAQEYDWELPRCCSISLVNNEFVAYELDGGTVIAISGDDGEVEELGYGVEELLRRYAEAWAGELGAD